MAKGVFMKFLLIGLLSLASISAFADCNYKVLPGEYKSKILNSVKASLSKENCFETKKLSKANFIISSATKSYGFYILPSGGPSSNGCMISIYGQIDENDFHNHLGALVSPEAELGEKCLSEESLNLLSEKFIQNLRDNHIIPAFGYAQ
jgi:hypothetical protein